MFTSTFVCYQKPIKKFNNLIIVWLTTSNRENILSNIWKLNIMMAWKMLGKEFITWQVNPISNTIFVTIYIHVINLGYLKNRSSYFNELLDDCTKKSN